MSRDRIEFGNEDFAAAVPFGFVTDRCGILTIVGDALRRRLDMQPGHEVDRAFTVRRPPRVGSFLDLPRNPKATVLLRSIDSDLELKGSIISIDKDEFVAFIGSAVVRDIGEFNQRGLLISDFPPSDATPDLLLSMQATRAGLDDARKLSAELEAALTDARAASEAKARFLAMMSHEIRTPLNGFGSMIDLLRDSPLADEQRENLDTMDRCARSLLVLVNDILEFSKLAADRVEIVRQPVAVVEAMTRIVDHFHAAARDRGIDLRLSINAPRDRWVSADIHRVRQVMANLIGNAIKFTLEGSIEVVVTTRDQALEIDVCDTGVGIKEEHRAGLFDPFVQGDTSTTRRFGGTGLGLTISRQLARAMGGDVVLVHSGAGGTRFRFTFAAPTSEPAPLAANGEVGIDLRVGCLSGLKVLVAEDDPTNQLIASRLLKKLDVESTIVADGQAAVAAAAGGHYDLILMDLMMPTLGGIDAAKAIRAQEGPCRDVPIIAFSAAAFETDRGAAAAAGMNGFLEKPARLDALRAILAAHMPRPVPDRG